MKLYELTSNWNQLQMMMEDGVDPSELADTLQAIEEAIDDKVHNIALVIRNFEAKAKAIKTEEKRLADRRKSLENNCKGLRNYTEQQMIAAGKRKIEGTLATVSLQKNQASLKIADDAVVPPEFMIPQEPKVDATGLKEALKQGMKWDGITLEQGESVRIR
ncbi:siphovirus Gp157 family protein [Bacillus cereus]|nr:siphovirus Gp157 family protein [Bacillus cereus]MEB8666278.1 siphovirus Gp157 family protein [Bacillus cereus]